MHGQKTLYLYFYVRGIHLFTKKHIISNCLIHVAIYKIITIFVLAT